MLFSLNPWHGEWIRSFDVSSLKNSRMNHQRYHVTTKSRRGHIFAHRHYHHHAQPVQVQVQEIWGHSNFHARRGNMHRGHSNFHARGGNMHNLPPRAFLQEVASFRYHLSHMQLDISNLSYEASLFCIVLCILLWMWIDYEV